MNKVIKCFNRKEKGIVVLSLFLTALVFVLVACGGSVDPASLKGGETRQTLAPQYFTGSTAKAYVAAREIPEVLDSLHCYCECKKHHGHKSLLTCFVTTHGRNCSICIDEAVMANKLHKKGYDVVAIRKAVDKAFKKYAR
ncbi:hypothetical protein MNBD_DELTA01-1220 [hydrothermal vent metagenome]|uniref:Uncharacterized protein n=1 Tax=hydrothermal vent metagenome TaxID=652676 RepID=A0A3B0RP02_9ZZZZ